MSRGGRIGLAVAVVVLLALIALGLYVRALLQPPTLARFAADGIEDIAAVDVRLGDDAAANIRPDLGFASGDVEIRARPAGELLFRARHLDAAAPWASARGETLYIDHITMVEPLLMWDALQQHLASRPARQRRDLKMPVVLHGIKIEAGEVRRAKPEAFAVEDLDFELDQLLPGQRSHLQASALVKSAGRADRWALDLQARIDGGAAGLALREIDATLKNAQGGTVGHLTGLVAYSDTRLAIEIEVETADWPEPLPRLPLSTPAGPVHLILRFEGSPDVTGDLALQIVRGPAHLAVEGQAVDLLAWWRSDPRPVLPPIDGSVRGDLIEIAGAILRGVDLAIDPDEPAAEPDAAASPNP